MSDDGHLSWERVVEVAAQMDWDEIEQDVEHVEEDEKDE